MKKSEYHHLPNLIKRKLFEILKSLMNLYLEVSHKAMILL